MELRIWEPVIITKTVEGIGPGGAPIWIHAGSQGSVVARVGHDYVIEVLCCAEGLSLGNAWVRSADIYAVADDI